MLRLSLAWLLFALALVSLGFGRAMAADQQMVSVSPLTTDTIANPGDSVAGNVEVFNPGETTQRITMSAQDFVANSTNGGPLFDDRVATDTANSLAAWIQFPQSSLSVEPQQRLVVPYHVTVPTKAAPGGHSAAIFVGALAPGSAVPGSSVQVSGRVGSLLFLTVTGAIDARGELISAKTVNAAGHAQLWFNGWPVRLAITINNLGNVQLTPSGTVTIADLRGRNVISQAVDPDGGRVLSKSARTFFVSFGDRLGYGRFTASTTMLLVAPTGQKIPVMTTIRFWVLPITATAWIVIGLVLFWFVFRWWLHRHDRRLRQFIAARGSQRSDQRTSRLL